MADDRAARKQAHLARAFRFDARLERWASDPALREQLRPSQRIAVGHYTQARAAALAEGVDVSDPNDRSAA